MARDIYKSYIDFHADNQRSALKAFTLFTKAAHHMECAYDAILDKDIGARNEACQKAISILKKANLTQQTPEQEEITGNLEGFCHSMHGLITRISADDNADLCMSLIACLKDMSNAWLVAGEVYEKRILSKPKSIPKTIHI